MLRTFTEYEKTLKQTFTELARPQLLIYALIVCRRHRPYYEEFHRLTQFGDVAALIAIDHAITHALASSPVASPNVAELRASVEAAIPGEEILEEIQYSPSHLLAQDAAIVHLYALGILSDGAAYTVDGRRKFHSAVEHAWWLANYCYDAADREAGDIVLPNGGIITPETEAEIEAAAPVRREVEWQYAILAELREQRTAQTFQALVERYVREPLLGRGAEA
jgi:hypothetical protein